jgi:hypothetical protein
MRKTIQKRSLISGLVVMLGVLLVLMKGCIFPYEPDITRYENVLVVDGLLTNLPGSCYVKLSRTYPYNEKNNIVESGATVRILDDNGKETILGETKSGLYQPADTNFAGIIGTRYKVSIKTASGEVCESTYEQIREPVEIGNLYFKYIEKGPGVNGIQLYVDTYDPFKESSFYAWDYEETWEFAVPYQSQSIYLPEMRVCYKDVISRQVLIESTKDYIDDKVIGFPLYYIDNTTNRLTFRYSVLLKQYNISEKMYLYFKNLKNINENTGTLFDRTPVILFGNIVTTGNSTKPVLGVFQVSGASVKRIFINRDDLPSQLVTPSEYEFCRANLLSKNRDRLKLDSLLRMGWAVMDTVIDNTANDTLIGLAISRSCFDCTTQGTTKKPVFWDEK